LGPSRLSLDIHITDLLQLLDHLDVESSHMVGISHGARIACKIAALVPGRIIKMVVFGLGTNLSPRAAALLKSWNSILKTGNLETLAWAMLPVVFGERYLQKHQYVMNDMVSAIVKRNHYHAIKAHLSAMVEYIVVKEAASASYPSALVANGDQDLIVQNDESKALAKMLGAYLITLKGVGHSANIEAPDTFNKAVAAFLEQAKQISGK
jgi:3-oxoadipate enol-lactonase